MRIYENAQLELIQECPICRSRAVSRQIRDVEDFAFRNIGGQWVYSLCGDCSSLYLSPRPREQHIGLAYQKYYTHGSSGAVSVDAASGASHKSLILRGWALLHRFVRWLKPRFSNDLVRKPPGSLLDLGCGNGRLLAEAVRMGWEARGIEIDETAVKFCREQGLRVENIGYRDLVEIRDSFDVILCAHVLEHVHYPMELLEVALSKLRVRGELWLQWPNPKADGLALFGRFWRGLEAPRHLTLPSFDAVESYIRHRFGNDYEVADCSRNWRWSAVGMYSESYLITQGREVKVTPFIYVCTVLRYLLIRAAIKNPEVCVLVVRRLSTGVQKNDD